MAAQPPEQAMEFMQLALAQADRAADLGEVPVGCVLVAADGTVLAEAHNERETLEDPTAHAEILVLRRAAQKLGTWRLLETTLYVTLEPCVMCAGAMVLARVGKLVYGCDDPKAGAVRSLYQIVEDTRLNHRIEVQSGIDSEACADRLRRFFAVRRV